MSKTVSNFGPVGVSAKSLFEALCCPGRQNGCKTPPSFDFTDFETIWVDLPMISSACGLLLVQFDQFGFWGTLRLAFQINPKEQPQIQFFGENVREFNFKLGENNKVEISANERKFRSTINKIHLDHSKSLNFKGVDYIDRETLKYIYKWEVTPEFYLINQVSQCEKVGTTFFFDYIGSASDKQKSLDKLLSKNQF